MDKPDRKQRLYLWLAGLFVSALLTADLIGGKLFEVRGNLLSAGMIAFPLTFVITDVLNEFYGPEATRRVTYLGLACAVFAFVIINVAIALPTSAESPLSADVFQNVFGFSARLYVASLTAYFIGQILDITVFTLLRRLTKHRMLWLRSTGSTLVSQALDTVVVTSVLLWGRKPLGLILVLIRNQYLMKVVIAIAMTPIIYGVHALLTRLLRVREPSEETYRG